MLIVCRIHSKNHELVQKADDSFLFVSNECFNTAIHQLKTNAAIFDNFFERHRINLREKLNSLFSVKDLKTSLQKTYITIHMPQQTSKILLVRLTANESALLFQIRVTCFARYTV